MLEPILLVLAHCLNWCGLFYIKLGSKSFQDLSVTLCVAYLVVTVVSYIFVKVYSGMPTSLYKIGIHQIFWSILWSFCLFLIYFIFFASKSVSQTHLFIGQAIAPIIVGALIQKAEMTYSRLFFIVVACSSLVTISFLRMPPTSGVLPVSVVFLIFAYLGAQISVRKLLLDSSSLDASVWMSFSLVLMFIIYVLVQSQPLYWHRDLFLNGAKLGLLISVIQRLVLKAYKTGGVMVTSLAQGSGVLIALILDCFFMETSFTLALFFLATIFIFSVYFLTVSNVKVPALFKIE